MNNLFFMHQKKVVINRKYQFLIMIYNYKLTFESGVEIRSLAVDMQCCYLLGKRREREPGRYFLEKRHKNGKVLLPIKF